MIPWWNRGHADAWEMEVDKWFTEEYQRTHEEARERRSMMTGPAHHQGSRSLAEYKQLWVRGFCFVDLEAPPRLIGAAH